MVKDLIQQKFGNTLDSGLIAEILDVGIIKSFLKDDIIIDTNQTIKYIPLLLIGNIKILREDDAGNDLLIYFLEAGETCTMSLTCCMGTSKSKIRAVAEQDSTLVMIPVQKMQEWFHNNHSWRNFILESYQARFEEMLDAIDSIAFLKMDERLHKYLLNKAILNSTNTIEIKHQEIAEDLHSSRVVISRLLKQLEKEKKIALGRNKIEILKA
ncbi:Crp/Fnr family transcriptional regulator [Seonamhaeicola algicola]|uniref:Crp/Fnr family transcriptional regulator n=1 Tax=Seonamhaeicola algicola TaxID=1719036 RepID=A0A5C7AWR8_9FLAO|nr:Crp/Fnr family transcriptional regulator [Seonamhaeicola algicola]TXE10132.1 Crp/Fnr family transcriptional regulator [Seonamhaeicola algicola]